MTPDHVNTVIVGGGQAGLAMSAHLSEQGIDHLVIERDRIAERWRTARWDSLVANGPAWHDRFPMLEFEDCDGDGFPTRDSVVRYFETVAKRIDAPLRCGVEVKRAARLPSGRGFRIETSDGVVTADHVVAATGPFQTPVIPPVVPDGVINQIHSCHYRNPEQLEDGGVLVVGAGSSGSQIADELLRSGRDVWLSVGPHDRPPRTYRGKDFVWWLGVLGKWQMKTPPAGREHVTIAVSGAYGGKTVDFRRFADRGMSLLGMTQGFEDGVISVAGDLVQNVAEGDANHLGLLAEAGITNIIWATGYRQTFDWLEADVFDGDGKPLHDRGVAAEQGVYFLGLPWLSMRGSSFIWGVWEDARYLASHIAGASALARDSA